MLINITGTGEALEKLEEIRKKAWDLENCIRRLPTTIGIEVVDSNQIIDSQKDTQ